MVHSHSHFAPSTARFHSHSVHSPTGLVPFPLCSQDSQVSFPFRSQSHWFSPIPTLLPAQPGFIPIPFPVPLVHSHSHFAPSTARFHSHSVPSPTGLVPFPLCSQDSQVSFPFCSQSHWFSPIPYHYKYLITPVVVLHQQCKAKLMTSKLHNEWDSAVKKRMKINIKYTNALSMQLSFISAECSLNTLRQQQSSQFPCEFLTTFIHLKLPLYQDDR